MFGKLIAILFVLVSVVVVNPVGSALAAPLSATNRDVTTIRTQIEVLSDALAENGYIIQDTDWDLLELGDSMTYNGTFYRGNDYRIIAIGGRGIADLDISVYDEDENLIDEDTATDALPMVDVSPRWNGELSIQVKLYSLQRGLSTYDDYVYGFIVAYK